jgi:DNA-directed RNA polymerase specialized sigma24 family protein
MAPDPLGTIDIEALLAGMRPKLHRYCARMVGSVIDGEDVLQDALIKAHRQFGGLAVPHRAQHRAGFPAPPQPAGDAAFG